MAEELCKTSSHSTSSHSFGHDLPLLPSKGSSRTLRKHAENKENIEGGLDSDGGERGGGGLGPAGTASPGAGGGERGMGEGGGLRRVKGGEMGVAGETVAGKRGRVERGGRGLGPADTPSRVRRQQRALRRMGRIFLMD